MTDSARKTPGPSIRTVTLKRLAAQLEKIENARRRLVLRSPESQIGESQTAEPRAGRPAMAFEGTATTETPGSFSPSAAEPFEKSFSTGIEALDGLLPDSGFRPGTLIEWLAEAGSGDQLALLAAQAALRSDRFLFVIDHEKTFYPPAAAALGIDLERLILVRPGKVSAAKTSRPIRSASKGIAESATAAGDETANLETLWALEQTLQSRGVAVAFCRLARLEARVFRRLQLAAERGGGLGFLIRAPSARNEPSWSDVRLWVEPVSEEKSLSGRRWRVEVLRCRRGAAGQRSIVLEFNDATHLVHPAGTGVRDQGSGARKEGQELKRARPA
jgi:protein ImuA